MLEHLKIHPEDIVTFPVWCSSVHIYDDTLFILKGKDLAPSVLSINYSYDILKTEGNFTGFLNPEEYRIKFGENLDILNYTSWKHANRIAIQK